MEERGARRKERVKNGSKHKWIREREVGKKQLGSKKGNRKMRERHVSARRRDRDKVKVWKIDRLRKKYAMG